MEQKHFCPSCGIENKSNAKFCEACGMDFGQQNTSTESKSSRIETQSNPTNFHTSEVKYADDGDRLVALIIDGMLFSAITGVLGLILGQNWWFSLGLSGNFWTDSWPSMIAGLAYFFFMESFNHGQTLGKIVMKIQTVNDSTLQPVSSKEAILHSLGKVIILPLDIIVGLIARDNSASDPERNQVRFTQKLSHTSVISLK